MRGAINRAIRLNDLYVGVPIVLGAAGCEKIIEVKFNADEKAMFDNSVAAVHELMEACAKLDPSLA